VARAHIRLPPARRQPRQAELADRFQHPETGFPALISFVPDKTFRDQGADPFQRVGLRGVADRSRGGDGKSADEDGQPLEQHAFGIVEQVIAPGDGSPHRLQPGGLIARAAGQERKADRPWRVEALQ
jgi:hypothetical protein